MPSPHSVIGLFDRHHNSLGGPVAKNIIVLGLCGYKIKLLPRSVSGNRKGRRRAFRRPSIGLRPSWYPRRDSNPCFRLRRPTLYPTELRGHRLEGWIIALNRVNRKRWRTRRDLLRARQRRYFRFPPGKSERPMVANRSESVELLHYIIAAETEVNRTWCADSRGSHRS